MNAPVNACRYCPEPERGHFQRWTHGIGWHTWTPPTQDQIKARMIARRARRVASIIAAGSPAGTDA